MAWKFGVFRRSVGRADVMSDILKDVYNQIYTADLLEQYQMKISECLWKFEEEGLYEGACNIRELSMVQINRFSRQATKENFGCNKKELLAYLKKETYRVVHIIVQVFMVFSDKDF